MVLQVGIASDIWIWHKFVNDEISIVFATNVVDFFVYLEFYPVHKSVSGETSDNPTKKCMILNL